MSRFGRRRLSQACCLALATAATAMGSWAQQASEVRAGTDEGRHRGAAPSPMFGGKWVSTYGPITFATSKDEHHRPLRATYVHGGGGTLEGQRVGHTLRGTYRDKQNAGEFEFHLGPDGNSLSGRFRVNGTQQWHPWVAFRAGSGAGVAEAEAECLKEASPTDRTAVWTGRWSSSYGPLTLTRSDGAAVEGAYTHNGRAASLRGLIIGRCLALQYVERDAAGLAVWLQSPDGKSFSGRWRPYGNAPWSTWKGRRATARPGKRP